MQFVYYDIGQKKATSRQVSLTRLATHVVTDWIPGIPPAMSSGFANVLATMLVQDTGSPPHWSAAQAVSGFERQWRMTTSWIMGVAFCREVVASLGYPFWAPVSAFVSGSGKTSLGYWDGRLPRSRCMIRRPKPPTSNLYPDYVVARYSKKTGVALAIAESKGTTWSISRHEQAPIAWRSQVNNAEFFFDGKALPVERRVVVASRINPSAKRAKTRRLVVRAWNSRSQVAAPPADAAFELLALHYYGVCSALGLDGTARMIALSFRRPEATSAQGSWDKERVAAAKLLDGERRRSRDWSFRVGERNLRLRLDPVAEEALRVLTAPDRGREKELETVLERIASSPDRGGTAQEHEFSRADGVTTNIE